ncbi:MAG: serine/threonine-protein kinase [Candidatus Melainabacteria bacterium]|nr:serine/threonine-protein kinase [Candidatus Melainabacteria bacterium]
MDPDMDPARKDDVRFSELLGGRYENITRIGEGGMGVVYRAHDPMLGIDVAIKILKPESSPLPVIRFQQEARAVAKLNHENVIRELDCGVLPDGSLYIVMEFQDGISLDNLLVRGNPVSVDRAVPIFKQIAAGMAHAHGLGILHRDLKPSNIIIVNSDGSAPTVKIVDFGLAVMTEAENKDSTTSKLVGSPLYMAPEISEEKVSDERSDIYALGCLMMESLTSDPTFLGSTAFDTMLAHRKTPAPLLSERLPKASFPSELEDVIDKCLSKSPEDRYQSMNDLHSDLTKIESEMIQKIIDDQRIFPASELPQTNNVQFPKINPWAIGAIATVVAGFAGITFFLSPELSAILKPLEPTVVNNKMPFVDEGDALIDVVLKDKWGEMEAVGGRGRSTNQAVLMRILSTYLSELILSDCGFSTRS